MISHALLKEAKGAAEEKQTLSSHWLALSTSDASHGSHHLWLCFRRTWLFLKKPKHPPLPWATEMEREGDCPWKEKLSTNARILKQENGLTLDVQLWGIFGPFTSLFAFVGKVSLEQAKHFEVFCLDRRNEEFIDFELERTSEVFNLVCHPMEEFSSMVAIGLQPWPSVPTSQCSCLSWVGSLFGSPGH